MKELKHGQKLDKEIMSDYLFSYMGRVGDIKTGCDFYYGKLVFGKCKNCGAFIDWTWGCGFCGK